MKRLASFLILALTAIRVEAQTVWSSITNSGKTNIVLADLESSYASQPYFYHDVYMAAALELMLKDYMIRFRTCASSGRSLQGHNEVGIPSLAIPHWANHTNSAFYIGIIAEDGNGGYSSNTDLIHLTNTLLAPLTTFNGTAYTNQPGWCANNSVLWVGQGPIPGNQNDGQPVYRDENNAVTNLFTLLGRPFVNEWHPLYNGGWSNDVASGTNAIRWFPNSHPGPPGQGDMGVNRLLQLGLPTNVYALDLDWNSGLVSSTNHCTATSPSKATYSFTFTFQADRLGMPFDVLDGICTNDASEFADIIPAFANAFMEIWRITNLPAGNYLVTEDGSNTAVVASTILAAGWNRWRLTAGWEWAQKRSVVTNYYNLIGCDPTTLLQHSAGLQGVNGGPDIVNWYSYAAAYFGNGTNGPALIADMNFISTNLDALDIPIHTAAQPAPHTIVITLMLPRFAAHR